ncbi:hypothetical protein Pcinc_019843 [Petrolisthes cinctipes]|uniref:HAUS augmin-like complex subunit 3 N-terminal domain-containing protein n=1 Tax=Petrolisthes cinctipes TaxID=88211 RepID=A0AAE1KKJ5_PETCI|nr:hypothetical protein Pcinc_019843 [Petrolisthes cinctipes]
MNGNTLVAHLQSLEVPGAESLDGADYDWIFQAKDTTPLANFLEWFTKNISTRDLITDAELDAYNELKDKGEVATGQQLEEMESFLSSVSSSLTLTGNCTQPPVTQEEQNRLKDQLQLLNKRKDHLNMHKMSLREELRRCNKIVEVTENELRKKQEELILASHRNSSAEQNFTKTLDSYIDRFRSFSKTPPEEAQFLSQLNLKEWNGEENKFYQTLQTYMRKQFPKSVRVLAGEENHTDYYLLEPSNLDLYLVCGEDQTEYKHNVQELNRITKLLCQTEEGRLEGLVLQARRKAEIEEADRMLTAIQNNQLPSTLILLQKQLGETQAGVAGVRREGEEQRRVMSGLVEEVTQLEAISTISGNYQLKLERQNYILTKQNWVLKQLASQVSRYSWVTIALNMESESIKDILRHLLKYNSIMVERSNNSKERMTLLKEMTEDIENQKASGQLPPPLQTLSQLLPSPPKPQKVVTGNILGTQIATLQNNVKVAHELVSTAKNPHFSRLDKMSSLCEALETSLFGHPGSLRSLPEAWLQENLAEQCLTLENQAWKLKYKLLHLLKQRDEKKKILQVDPTAREDEKTWTSNFIMALD